MAIRAIRLRGLSRLFLRFLGRFIQPAAQHHLRILVNFREAYARTHVHLGIHDFAFGLEESFSRVDLHQHQAPCGERVHHVQIAAVGAQLAYTRGDADVGALLDQFRAGNKRISRPTASFFVFDGDLRLVTFITSLRRFPASLKDIPKGRYPSGNRGTALLSASSLDAQNAVFPGNPSRPRRF